MKQAFVGICDYTGLHILVPEHPHTVRFLSRRASRHHQRSAVCFWAVLGSEAVPEIQLEIASGNSGAALLLLQAAATEAGPVFPDPSTESLSSDGT